MMSSAHVWTRPGRSSASGASASAGRVCRASRRNLGAGGQPAFPPSVVVQVKALACELPSRRGLPLSRFSLAEIRREVLAEGIVAEVSGATLWRWLSRDALRPWRFRSWIFPRDPAFVQKAARILDLYEDRWEGAPLASTDFVVCADEKTSIQARQRRHACLPPISNHPQYVEHEYQRKGAWAYLAAWDVRQAKVFGRCELKSGIAPFDRLVAQVMNQEPYRSARRVFWITDNGSSHRGQKAAGRLCSQWPTLILVPTPIHASWLNQVEIYFSIVQRKVLTPNDFASLGELEDRLLRFQDHYQEIAAPFQWTFRRRDLTALMERLETEELSVAA
jgi:DDE superfamily endonuclease